MVQVRCQLAGEMVALSTVMTGEVFDVFEVEQHMAEAFIMHVSEESKYPVKNINNIEHLSHKENQRERE